MPTGAGLLVYEPLIRLGAFSLVFAVMALWEVAAPFRHHDLGRARRWPGNIGIVVLNTLLVRLLIPAGLVGVAIYAEGQHRGLFNAWPVSAWLAIPIVVVVLDLAIYAQHVVFHQVPALWRLHRMHHADLELDVSTGARFHPIEIIISLLLKMVVVVALGAPALAVLIFEVLLNATSMFNHANIRLPARLEPIVRLLVVTPDMHRVHHSVLSHETNSNYGFNLALWDRLFGTYRTESEAGQEGITFGVEAIRDPREQRLDRMLIQPFSGNTGG
jgi:sterol desaturase/sphingolipid hydroxylase (fatty acid hydroxylase superfamily)